MSATVKAKSAGHRASCEAPQDAETLALVLQAVECLGGQGAFVHSYDPGARRLRLVGSAGPAAEHAGVWADLSDEQDAAPARAVRHGEYVWQAKDGLGTGASGTAAVPLLGAHGPVAVLSVIPAGLGEPDDIQRSFLCSLAGWASAHLGGASGTSPGHGPAAGPERTVRMGELTEALAEALTSEEVVQAVAEHVLPPFGADGLIVWIFEGNRLRVVGSAGYTQEALSLLDGHPVADYPAAADVLGNRTARFLESAVEYREQYPTLKRVVPATRKNAWAFLPLIASGHAMGMCLVSFARARSFSHEERTLLTALSGLVGQSLERARLYDVEHARAQRLQNGLLPRTLPRLPAVRAAARYLPAGRGEEVGGDWYDVIRLSADRVAVVIGDVMGHGMTEAATMGQLRTSVRTLAALDMPPDELVCHLNDVVSDLGEDCYATCLYGVFDPVTRMFCWSLAGHTPPLIVHPDGTVFQPDLLPDPPLGAAEPPFAAHQVLLPEESLLVLCTDGLVDSDTQSADQGLVRLRQVVTQAALPLTAQDENEDLRRLNGLCDTIVSTLLTDQSHTNDDAALLVAHTLCTEAGHTASCALPYDPRAAGIAREYIRQQLAEWGLDDLTATTELLASELVGNVIRHATGPIRLRLLRSRSLTCEVYDGSLSTPRIRHAAYTDEDGRGLQLITSLSRRWGARYLSDGKCIWTEQDIQ